ncbi:hypothetical protein BGX27_005609 [Mortierella sp. AM989]|nr:hypothetical protein BGX27_005609 [Mortierella sp. AM989]
MTILMQDALGGNYKGMNAADMQPSLTDVLDHIRVMPRLQPQERRVVLRELIASCDESDIQALQRLLGQTTKSGFDLVSALPAEVSHHIFLYLGGMDLVRCRAVCRPWRSMIKSDTGLWKAKIQAWNPAECSLLKDNYPLAQCRLLGAQMSSMSAEVMEEQAFDQGSLPVKTTKRSVGGDGDGDGEGGGTERETILDSIASQHGFVGWETALIQELALKRNWKHGRYAYEMTVTLTRNIKPIVLAWPYLILVDDWPKLYKISLMDVRRDRYRVIPIGDKDERYAKIMELQGYGSISCMAWDSFSFAKGSNHLKDRNLEEDCSLPLALGGFLRSVRLCNPDTKTSIPLPDVHHGFPLHLCFLRDQVLSVTLDGQITFFQKGEDYRPHRSCTVATKLFTVKNLPSADVLQVAPVTFGEMSFEREYNGEMISWNEAICLGYEDGCKLLQFQAIADNTPPYRNELLILFEDPNTRQRRVLCVKMEPGFQSESSRTHLSPSFSLGRGGDARDSIAMYRDRIAIVSHRNCSSDLGHYCVLRLSDLQEDVVVSTEYAQHIGEGDEDAEEEEEGEEYDDEEKEEGSEEGESEAPDSGHLKRKDELVHIPRRGKPIHLNDFAGHKAACRVLAMDHARIVLGMGPRIVKILCLV